MGWRRGRDSNPRCARRTAVFKTATFGRSVTSPCPCGPPDHTITGPVARRRPWGERHRARPPHERSGPPDHPRASEAATGGRRTETQSTDAVETSQIAMGTAA